MKLQQLKKILHFVLLLVLFFSGCKDSINDPDESINVIINLNDVRQVIRGFGAANVLPWRPDMTTDEVNKAFGVGDGQIGFTILRLRVPSDTSEFSLNLPTAQLAHSIGVTIIASPWSPPAWMKTNNNIVGGRLIDTCYAAYAAHLKSFVDLWLVMVFRFMQSRFKMNLMSLLLMNPVIGMPQKC